MSEEISDAELARFKNDVANASRDDPYAWRESPVSRQDVEAVLARLDAVLADREAWHRIIRTICEQEGYRDGLRWRCSVHGPGASHDRVNVERWAQKHADAYHPDADVTYGPLPEPPHEHDWVWGRIPNASAQSKSATGLTGQVICRSCPARFHALGRSGTPYSGPIPAHLQASPEELDTSQRAQRVKEGL